MSSLGHSQHLKIPFEVIASATRNFEKCIGHGGYGKVYIGELSFFGRATTVAVKRLNEHSGQGLKEFLTEIQLLSDQRHQNLITLFGYCEEGKEKMIVYEFAARGSLDTYLRSDSSCHLTWQRRLEICVDVARGLNHLHSHAKKDQIIIHRDIKSSNILLDDKWVAKISDLGLSKLARVDGNTIVSNACGTFGYCDPEYHKTGILTKESDIYSFGIVLFEVLCGRLCAVRDKENGFWLSGPSVKEYYEKRNLEVIIDPSLSEQMGSDSMRVFAGIAYRCLLDDRRQRPAMDLVVKELEESLRIHLLSEGHKSELVVSEEDEVSNSVASAFEEARRIRGEKVLRIFQHFDLNKDGGLNKQELSNLVVAMGTGNTINYSEFQEFYNMSPDLDGKTLFDTKRGLNFDGVLMSYKNVDEDFRKLGFELKSQDNNESSTSTLDRREKVWRIFQHFDLNKDGGLDKEELSNLFVAVHDENASNDSRFQEFYLTLLHLDDRIIYDKKKGLTLDGLSWFCDMVAINVDEQLMMLGLDLKSQDNNEETPSPQERQEVALEEATRIRNMKVWKIFEHFDLNKDGGLNREEMANLIVATCPHKTFSDSDLRIAYDAWSIIYDKYTHKEKGLSFDGLLLSYDEGHGDVDNEFEMLGLELKSQDKNDGTPGDRIREAPIAVQRKHLVIVPQRKVETPIRKRDRILNWAKDAWDDL